MLQTVEISIEDKYNNFNCGRKLLMIKLGGAARISGTLQLLVITKMKRCCKYKHK